MLEIGRMVGGWIKSAGNEELIAGEWTPGEYHRFTVFEPKERPIVAAPYRDRVVHHALCNIIEPLFERGFMEESYACREGKGTHAALDRFVKQGLGRRGYLRYMDDFLVFGDCKRELAGIKDSIAGFLRERLQLELKANKSFVVPARSGLGFLGFRLFPCYRRLDGANVAKFVNRFRALRAGWHGGTVGFPEIKASLRAWVAHAEHGNTWNLRTELLAEVAL